MIRTRNKNNDLKKVLSKEQYNKLQNKHYERSTYQIQSGSDMTPVQTRNPQQPTRAVIESTTQDTGEKEINTTERQTTTDIDNFPERPVRSSDDHTQIKQTDKNVTPSSTTRSTQRQSIGPVRSENFKTDSRQPHATNPSSTNNRTTIQSYPQSSRPASPGSTFMPSSRSGSTYQRQTPAQSTSPSSTRSNNTSSSSTSRSSSQSETSGSQTRRQ